MGRQLREWHSASSQRLWLSLLMVALLLFLLAAVAVLFAKRSAREATPPEPALAIDEATRTVDTLKSHV